MYRPAHFAEDRVEVLQALLREHPFATLVSQAGGELVADHLPLQLSPDGRRLLGHVARANPLWRMAAAQEVLVIFQGPQAYVSPSWYPSKREHGKAVPTWNYVVVHARGRLTAIEDPRDLRALLDDLVNRHEGELAEPWQVSDAPPEFIEKMLSAIVGIEIGITALAGKWKTSQNQPAANRAGVVAGLGARGTDNANGMAALIATSLRDSKT
ncbi:MAG: FMN-binding negative transcriptional regulator [Rhodocyclales bacterium]|nr:FMN-binding negative transcriptional regulator [Rhodocyclales bacterium]